MISDLLDIDSVAESLSIALQHPKTLAQLASDPAKRAASRFFPSDEPLINSCLSRDRSWIVNNGAIYSSGSSPLPSMDALYVASLHRARHRRLAFYCMRDYRKRSLSNLALAKDLASAIGKTARRIAKKSFENLAINVLEYSAIRPRNRLFPRHPM